MARSLLLVAALGLLCITARAQMDDDQLPADELKGEWDSILDVIDSKNGTEELGKLVKSLLDSGDFPADVYEAFGANDTVGTLFVPTDEAIQAVAPALAGVNASDIVNVLFYHFIPGQALTLADIRAMDNMLLESALPAPEGELKIHVPAGSSKAALKTTSGQTVPIYQYNIRAGSAVIHTVKSVLIPGTKTLHSGGGAPSPAPSMS